ncbi:rolling circle replication-associated protein [Collimonas antrihumi]|uniref:rolling circle replication-associated protein n=1 Tax=Collimonas antrihumi TaxID=1940615 RepID=UPI001B8C06CC|nr:hypothetical protein [Collimonas antrihumi]
MHEFHTDSIESSSTFVTTPQEKPQGWTDDGDRNTWQDVYTARQRIFPNGQSELTISKEKYFIGPAVLGKARAKRGERMTDDEGNVEDDEQFGSRRARNDDVASRRAKKNVRLCCKEISADRLVTLTYRENMKDRDLALKHFDGFRRRLGRCKAFHYVAVMEEQERGAIHFHIAVNGRQDYNLVRSIWQSVVGLGQKGEQMAQANVRDPHKFGFGKNGAHKLASYIAKYCGKQMDVRELNQKRYFRSKGIVLPVVNTWRISATTMLGAVQTAFSIVAEFGLEGVQTWCNNALGVVWIATAPRSGPLINTCPF